EELRSAAYLDPLTGIANRAEFTRKLQQLSEYPNKNQVAAIVDIDHFSDVNDGLGQDVGNALLRSVALRLTEQLGKNIFVARIAADVFGLIGPVNLVSPQNL
ncbi:MAG TPA: diguanylate phosphodiesterase, partial [Idiomarina sp.]|nr:diguanylate phosphodiesterase [Idiomarina sp.]